MSRLVGRLAGVVCTKSHLLLLGNHRRFKSNDSSDESSDDTDDDTDDDSDNGNNTNTQQKQLKLLLRVKRSYNTAVINSTFSLLICARGGTLDLFKVYLEITW